MSRIVPPGRKEYQYVRAVLFQPRCLNGCHTEMRQDARGKWSRAEGGRPGRGRGGEAADGADEQGDQREPGDPDLDGAGDGDSGDGGQLRDRALCDREAGEAPAGRLGRDRGGQAQYPQPDPDGGRVRGAVARLQPHASQPGGDAAGAARRERRPRQEGRRAGPGEHGALRDEPAQERLPGHDEPRAAHAAELDHRVFRSAFRQRGPERPPAPVCARTSRLPARCCWA